MCVFVEIDIPGHPRREAGKLSKAVASRGLLNISAQHQAGSLGLYIRAYYAGRTHEQIPPRTEAESTLEEFMHEVRNDRVGGNVRYHVRGEAA
jgi:hypothetical protein